MSYLASPFRYAPTYDVGLNTGTPEVGATLRRPKNKKTPEEEKNPSRVPNEGNGNGEGTSSGIRSGSVSSGISASAGAAGAVARPGQAARSLMAEQDAESNNAANLSQSQFNTLIHPNPISAPASPTKTTVAPAAQHPGFWSQVGHDISSVAHNPIVQDVMHFGDPVRSYDSGGLVGAVSGNGSDVIQPSNVYSPNRSFPEVGQGSPKVIQGSVAGAGEVSPNIWNALPRSAAYNGNGYGASLGKQFMKTGSSSASDSPWYDSIPNDLSSIGEDILAGL